MMKNGVSSYSFAAKIVSKEMTIYDCIRKAADLGFDGIEMANLTDEWLGITYDLDTLKNTAQEAGIEICSWAMSADYSHDTENAVAHAKEEIDQAAYLGVKIVRTDVCGDDVPDPYAKHIIAALQCLSDYAKEKGITLVVENHGGYFSRPERLEKLTQLVARENFGLLCDFANYADADENPQLAAAKIRFLIRHVHMKDCHLLPGSRVFPGQGWYVTQAGNYWRCAITGQGNIPYFECIKLLQLCGYDGYLIQEFEGIEDCVYAVAQGLDFTKRLLKALPTGMWSDEIGTTI